MNTAGVTGKESDNILAKAAVSGGGAKRSRPPIGRLQWAPVSRMPGEGGGEGGGGGGERGGEEGRERWRGEGEREERERGGGEGGGRSRREEGRSGWGRGGEGGRGGERRGAEAVAGIRLRMSVHGVSHVLICDMGRDRLYADTRIIVARQGSLCKGGLGSHRRNGNVDEGCTASVFTSIRHPGVADALRSPQPLRPKRTNVCASGHTPAHPPGRLGGWSLSSRRQVDRGQRQHCSRLPSRLLILNATC